MRGDVSAGAAMTTARANPSAPKLSSINSLTSRPRSPIKPTTIISAEVNLVIILKRTLLPTPLPANNPMRWPRPTVSKELIARIPTSKGSRIGKRDNGLIICPSNG